MKNEDGMVISSWDGLRAYGVMPLTGEACNASMRLLCDLTPLGKALMEEFLGSTLEFKAGSNWNSSKGAVASVMLAHEMFAPLAAYCLLYRENADFAVIWQPHIGTVQAMSTELLQDYRATGMEKNFLRVYSRMAHPGSGGRNQHQFSGRTS